MIEVNPHRRKAQTIAFICYVLAGAMFCLGVILTLTVAFQDMTHVRGVEGLTHARLSVIVASYFGIAILMVVLLGYRIQRVFGQHRRTEKSAARVAVGCLRLGSLGCGLWALPGLLGIIFTGQMLSSGEPAGIQDLFVITSVILVVIILMLSVSWFISINFGSLNEEERRGIYRGYLNVVHAELPRVADPETRAYLQRQTEDVLPKLDQPLKSTLLADLSKANLLTGGTRIVLRNADFRGADLSLSDLPGADLREINLEQARLEGSLLFKVNLYKARLKRCNLSRARLQEANLEQADLTKAVLKEAKLRAANLHRTILIKANLSGANLQQANLRYANLEGAVLTEADLRGADLTGAIVTTAQLQEAKV